MLAAVDVQHHARQRPTGSPLAMGTRFVAFGQQASLLQSLLHPAVAKCNTVDLTQLLVEVPRTQIGILLSEQLQHLFQLLHWHPLRTRSAFAPIPQPAIRSEEHTSELQSQSNLVCRLLLEK